MQSNPIQQRIELICEKWEDAKVNTRARLVLIRCQPDETEMVDTFYTYMIGTDTPIMDIAFHFDSECYDPKHFSKSLLAELEEIMHIWNNSEKDSSIEFVPVPWQADYSMQNDKNPALMFVKNFNALAKEMNLSDGLFAVAVFKGLSNDKNLNVWFKDALEAGINPAVKFLFHDTVANPVFEELAIKCTPQITTIPINLNMPQAMEQVAAMGDPNDPATAYRQSFMKMMNAISAGNETKAEKWGKECIKTATQFITKDPYWILQVVVVYIALANDKIRYIKKDEALAYANKAVETATASKTYFENDIVSQLMAQAVMFRGTVFFINCNRTEACTDFSFAFETYKQQGNMPLAIEACRMAGESALKSGQKDYAAKILSDGARLGNTIDAEAAAGTTYAGVLDLLLQTNHVTNISMQELNEIALPIYGPDWLDKVRNWKQIPDNVTLKKKELEAAEN